MRIILGYIIAQYYQKLKLTHLYQECFQREEMNHFWRRSSTSQVPRLPYAEMPEQVLKKIASDNGQSLSDSGFKKQIHNDDDRYL